MILGGSRGAHGEESGRSGTRYGSHAATPGDSTPTAPQERSRRVFVTNNPAAPNPLDEVITSSELFRFDIDFQVLETKLWFDSLFACIVPRSLNLKILKDIKKTAWSVLEVLLNTHASSVALSFP